MKRLMKKWGRKRIKKARSCKNQGERPETGENLTFGEVICTKGTRGRLTGWND